MKRLGVVLACLAVAGVSWSAPVFRTVVKKVPGQVDAKVVYPVWFSPTPEQSLTTRVIRQRGQAKLSQIVDSAKEDAKFITDRKIEYFLQSNAVVSVIDHGTGFISAYSASSWYTGGAHPNHDFQFVNALRQGSKARLIGLGDLLRKGKTLAEVESELVLPALNAIKKARGMDPVEKLDPGLLDQFVVTPSGIAWLFSHYQAGAYAEGSYTVKKTWEEVGALLKPPGTSDPEPASIKFQGAAVYRERIALPEGAKLVAQATNAEGSTKAIEVPAKNPPIEFSLNYERDFFRGKSGELKLMIEVDGEVWFASETLEMPAQGWPAPTTIVLYRKTDRG